MNDKIIKILETATHAPSGDNSQPWEFEVADFTLSIYNVPGKDNKIFNYKERGSLFAHGALIENIIICASKYSFNTKVDLLPDPETPNLTAKITFLEGHDIEPDILFEFIEKRHTNRKPYQDGHLTDVQKQVFQSLFHGQNCELQFVDDPESKKVIAHATTNTERIMLQHKPLHDLFFSFIRWTRDEESTNPGLFVKTMELAAPQQMIFKLYKSWNIAKIFNFLGLPKKISSENAKNYQRCAAFGLVSADDSEPATYIRAGRAFQRLWLEATKNSLSIQPVGAILYLAARVRAEGSGDFPQVFSDDIIKASEAIVAKFKPIKNPVMLFRIGVASEPTAFSKHVSPKLKSR